MKASKQKQADRIKSKFLYFGTDEQTAKEAPTKGLPSPVILTDVNAASFAAQTNCARWGIVQVNIEYLLPDNFAPFHGYLEKKSRRSTHKNIPSRIEQYFEKAISRDSLPLWRDSLLNCGILLYLAKVSPHAISKITIYNKDSNAFVTNYASKYNPWEITNQNYKKNYSTADMITKWLMCYNIEEITDNIHYIDHLRDKQGLDIFYFPNEGKNSKAHSWWSIEKT